MVFSAFNNLLGAAGIDRTVATMLAGRAWAALAGPVTILFVASRLSPEEQGYYYTFFSVAGMTLLFELGVSYVLVQFASHEKAHLKWAPSGTLEGNAQARARLGALLRWGAGWYGAAAVLIGLALGLGGTLFFQYQSAGRAAVAWPGPWALVVLATVGSLVLNPWYATLEGVGLVQELSRVRFQQGILGTLLAWAALAGGLGLYAAACANLCNCVRGLAWLAWTKRAALADLWRCRAHPAALCWRTEILPMQWRMALSWVGSYLALQLFTPVLFAWHGEREAGRWGMSFTLVGAVTGVASFWIYARSPVFGTLIARRAYLELDRLFFRTLAQSVVVSSLGLLVLGTGAAYVQGRYEQLGERLLPPLPLALLALAGLVSHVVMAQAVYLRAHKQDPFFVVYLALGLSVGLTAYVLGRPYGAVGMAAGYCAAYTLLGLGLGTRIFLAKRQQWHAPAAERVGPPAPHPEPALA